jgi:EPS-associated MarR family transcriptional regulator
MDEIHYKLLKILQDHPNVSQRELGRKMGVSLGKTNYCLRALINKGWIKAASFRRSENKVAYSYLLTPRGIKGKIQAATYFLGMKIAEYEALEKEIEQLSIEVNKDKS